MRMSRILFGIALVGALLVPELSVSREITLNNGDKAPQMVPVRKDGTIIDPSGGSTSTGSVTAAGTNGTQAQAVQGINGGVPQAVTWTGALPVNNSQINGVSIATGAGASNAGTQRVVNASDSSVALNGPFGADRGPAAALGVVQQDGQTTVLSASAAGPLTNATYTTGAIPTAGYASASVQLTNIGTGNTVTYEGSNDGISWYQLAGYLSFNIGAGAPALQDTAVSARIFPINFAFFRTRVSAYGSGTVTAYVTMKVTNVAPIATYSTLGSGPGPGNIVAAFANSATSAASGISLLSRLSSSAASTNATLVKSSAGRVYKVYACNTTTTAKFVRLFNKATAPVPGTDTPFWSRALPPSATAGVPLCQSFDMSDIGYYLSAGIGYDATGANPDNDATALGAGDVTQLSVEYQ